MASTGLNPFSRNLVSIKTANNHDYVLGNSCISKRIWIRVRAWRMRICLHLYIYVYKKRFYWNQIGYPIGESSVDRYCLICGLLRQGWTCLLPSVPHYPKDLRLVFLKLSFYRYCFFFYYKVELTTPESVRHVFISCEVETHNI